MAEYIEREKALAFQNELEPCLCRSAATGEVFSATKDADLVAYLQGIPAADVRPVARGRWEKRMEEEETLYYKSFTPIWSCSECGTEYDPSLCMTINFCHNCGADMRGGAGNG